MSVKPREDQLTDPPFAGAGLSAGQAVATGRKIKVGGRAMVDFARGREDETAGSIEIVVDADSDRIRGGTILGTGGDEAIHAILDTMANGATANRLRMTVHIHPTVSKPLPTIAGTL